MRFNVDNYVDVQERINKFWSENPNGSIVTEVIYGANFDQVIVRAAVYKTKESGAKADMLPDATGIAAEMRGESARDGANFTSWHENAETSAIGRALANMGYATSRSDRPSRQEMEKVERHEGQPLPARTRTTSQNTAPQPNPDNHMPPGWTDLWNFARSNGFKGKPDLEAAIGHLGSDPAYAMERLQTHLKDRVQQPLASLA